MSEIKFMDEQQLKNLEVQLKRSLKNLKVGSISNSPEAQRIWEMLVKIQNRRSQLSK